MSYVKKSPARTQQALFDSVGNYINRYNRYETGIIEGRYRDIPAIIADETGFDGLGFNSHVGSPDDNWHTINLFDSSHKYVDTVAIAGAMDIDHALTLAVNQYDHLNVDYGVLVANESEIDGFDGMGWSVDTLGKLMNNPSQDQHYLPIITKKALLNEQARVTADTVMWDGITLKSHGGDETRLLLDMQKNDGFGELTSKFNMAETLSKMAVSELGFDALMDTNNRLDMMKDRLFSAMSKTDMGGLSVANVTLTKPFKKAGTANVAMQFDLSDGQTFVIWFHNPDADPKKLAPGDMMVSWKWMLNNRDVTAAVSPKSGENVQIPQLATRMMKVAAKNSKRFAAAQAKKSQNQQALTDAQKAVDDKKATVEQLDKDIADLNAQIEEAGKVVVETPIEPEINTANKRYQYLIRHAKRSGAAYIKPSIGKKFTQSEIDEMMALLENAKDKIQFSQVSDNGSIYVVISKGGKDALEGIIESVIPKIATKEEQKRIDELETEKKIQQEKATEATILNSNNPKVDGFIKAYFTKDDGTEFLNNYNRNRLIRFLAGEDDSFQGAVNGSWSYLANKIPKIFGADNKIDWQLLKDTFNQFATNDTTTENPQTGQTSKSKWYENQSDDKPSTLNSIELVTFSDFMGDQSKNFDNLDDLQKYIKECYDNDPKNLPQSGDGYDVAYCTFHYTNGAGEQKTIEDSLYVIDSDDGSNGFNPFTKTIADYLFDMFVSIKIDPTTLQDKSVLNINTPKTTPERFTKNAWKGVKLSDTADELNKDYGTDNDFWEMTAEQVQSLPEKLFQKLSDALENANYHPENRLFALKRAGKQAVIDLMLSNDTVNNELSGLIWSGIQGEEKFNKDAQNFIDKEHNSQDAKDLIPALREAFGFGEVTMQPTQDTPMTQEQQDIDYLNSIIDGSLELSVSNMKDVVAELQRLKKTDIDKDLLRKAVSVYKEFALSVKLGG